MKTTKEGTIIMIKMETLKSVWRTTHETLSQYLGEILRICSGEQVRSPAVLGRDTMHMEISGDHFAYIE